MLFLLPRKFEGVESLNGGSALFSGGVIGSKIFRTCGRKQGVSIMNITHYGAMVDQCGLTEPVTFSAIISAGVLQSCWAVVLLPFGLLLLNFPSRCELMASASL